MRRLEAVRRRLERGLGGPIAPMTRPRRVTRPITVELPLPPIRRVPFGGEAFDIEALRD